MVDRLWMGRISGVDTGVESLDEIPFDGFTAPVVYTRILGNGDQQTRLDHILITLYNHQTHHRGQVHAMLTHTPLRY
ncbi:MAG: hypothetical protein IIA33_03825 [Planctomycetes bacterium]|nr:hypothetical protein [Planctomycetota bacterium]